jgi:hypothetical protein
MKIAITGHTNGIGKSIHDFFESNGHECLGFSRSNKFNVGSQDSRNQILTLSQGCDIFVNNAFVFNDDSQYKMLVGIWNLWIKNPEKIIINISSTAADQYGNVGYPHQDYAKQKAVLDNFCEKNIKGPWIINLKPGFVDTDLVKDTNIPGWPKMSVDVLPTLLEFILTNKDRFKIRSATFQLF